MAYIVKQITVADLDETLVQFIIDNGDALNALYGHQFNWRCGFPLKYAIEKHVVLVAYKDNTPIGFMVGSIGPTIFDIDKTVLRQEVLFAKHPKATRELLRYFIDLGRTQANYIISCIGKHTNIKPRSLENLGFAKLEELYRLEVLGE